MHGRRSLLFLPSRNGKARRISLRFQTQRIHHERHHVIEARQHTEFEQLLAELLPDKGYALTKMGRELHTQLTPLGVWSEKMG